MLHINKLLTLLEIVSKQRRLHWKVHAYQECSFIHSTNIKGQFSAESTN